VEAAAVMRHRVLDGVLSSLIWTFLPGVRILFRFGSYPVPIRDLWENRKLYASCATPGLSRRRSDRAQNLKKLRFAENLIRRKPLVGARCRLP
jgi:hypothetical protein